MCTVQLEWPKIPANTMVIILVSLIFVNNYNNYPYLISVCYLGGSRCGKTYAEITVWVCNEIKRCGGEVDIITMPKNPDEENMFRYNYATLIYLNLP